jgi:hypothetical protein
MLPAAGMEGGLGVGIDVAAAAAPFTSEAMLPAAGMEGGFGVGIDVAAAAALFLIVFKCVDDALHAAVSLVDSMS